jgi:hypothetical protein
MAEKLNFDINVQNNQLDKALESGIQKAGKLEGSLETALAVFGGNLITKGFDAVIGGFQSLINFSNEAIDAAAAQEVATNNLNNALARQGNFTKQASQDLLEFASNMQKLTVFEDDAVISSTALLQSLSNLSVDGLKAGVTAAADFATVLGIDLETATRLVAKAAEGNISVFKRYGVQIQEGKTDSETFANTLEALNSQFGGASAAQLNTYNGSLKALKNAYGDLLEPIGDIVVKNPLIVAGFNEIKSIINGTNEEISAGVPAFQEFLNDGIFALSAGSQVLLDIFDFLTVGVKQFINVLQIAGGFIASGLVDPIRDLIDGVLFLGSNIPGLSDKFEGLVNPLEKASIAIDDFTNRGVKGLSDATGDNIFRDLSTGIDTFTSKIVENASAVKIAQNDVKNSNAQRLLDEDENSAEILKRKQQLGAEILTLQAQIAGEESAQAAQLAALGIENEAAANIAKTEAIYAQKILEAQAVYEGELLKNQSIASAQEQALANEKAFQTLSLVALKASSQKEVEVKRAMIAEEKRIAAERIANQASTFATIATLASANNKGLAAIGKAAAITQIAIDTPVAISRALAAFPPPFNFAAAGLVGAAMAAQAARVAGVQFENGGIVGQSNGASAGADNRVATIRDGELILNSSQQKTLFDAINSGNLGGGQIIVQIDGREIAHAVRSQIQGGFRLA